MLYFIFLSFGTLFGWVLCALLTANDKRPPANCSWCYDYHLAEDLYDLGRVLYTINESGYQLISVTKEQDGMYTVFFGRMDT